MVKSQFSVNLEYYALRCACAFINALPYPLAALLARGAGWAMVRVFGFKRSRTLQRIKSVFPGISQREAMKIAVKSLQNILLNAVEMMRAPSMTRKWMDKHVLDGLKYKEKLQSYANEGRGVVVMVPHSGNWYMAAWSMAKYGLPLFALAAHQRNPKFDAWMNRQYGDVEILYRDRKETMFQIIEKLGAGRVFAILPDLRVPKRDVEVDFLGGKANVSHSAAFFAVKSSCPIVVAQMYRENGKHVFNHIATLRPDTSNPDAKEEAVRLTKEAMRLIDEQVRLRPGDWFWYNKRWILEPPRR
jgi:KDO2-lipid IV(A) lauroyltransferase